MLVNLAKRYGYGVPVLCVTLVLTTVPHDAVAQGAGQDRPKVLAIPVQVSDQVSPEVGRRMEEYLRALAEMESKIEVKFLHAPGEVLQPAEKQPVEAMKERPVEVQKPPMPKGLERGLARLERGIARIKRGRYEAGLSLLVTARRAIRRHLRYLDDFGKYVDVLVWMGIGFLKGGYREEAASTIRQLLVLRPDLVPDANTFGRKFALAVARAQRRVRRKGSLVVKPVPEDAVVFVDGRRLGQGNQTVMGLVRGKHYVRVIAPGYEPYGRFIRVRSRPLTVTAKLKSLKGSKQVAKQRSPKRGGRHPTSLASFVRKGNFGGAFRRAAKEWAGSEGVDFVLTGYITRSEAGYHYGLFVFNSRTNEVLAIEPAVIDWDLTNLQTAVLDLEGRLVKVMTRYPGDAIRLAAGQVPAIYKLSRTRAPATAQQQATKPEVRETRPTPAVPTTGKPAVATEQTRVSVEESTHRPAVAEAQTRAKARERTVGGVEEIPPDFPIEETYTPVQKKPWYKKWWVWTAVAGAAAVAAGVGLAVGLGTGASGPGTFKMTAQWQ